VKTERETYLVCVEVVHRKLEIDILARAGRQQLVPHHLKLRMLQKLVGEERVQLPPRQASELRIQPLHLLGHLAAVHLHAMCVCVCVCVCRRISSD
jgi:hypothetical protein